MGLATVDFRATGGPLVEYEMVHCRHCRAGIPKRLYPDQAHAPGQLLRVQKAQGGYCHKCAGPICLACVADGRCRPYGRQLEALHARITKRLDRETFADSLGLNRR